MSLKQQLQDELKAALKAGDANRRLTIGMVLSAVKNKELEKRNKISKAGVDPSQLDAQSALTDDEAIDVVQNEVKKRREALEMYTQNSRADLADKEKAELNILMAFLPQQLSEDEIRTHVKAVIAEVQPQGIKDMGKVIGQVMPRIKGQADGQVVSRIVKEELGV
ncbi:MAG: GatB/YqeY domain-containing protein [Candidatus Yanofskybacteria bacterium]|nr:GatB/YqeY domain-containing protein [Candidatus Yanofskybacteria bacterium]